MKKIFLYNLFSIFKLTNTNEEKTCKNFMLENNGKLLKVTVWPADYTKIEHIGK